MRTTAPSAETPRHLAVTDEFRRRIRSGEWKAGDRLPSYTEARTLFGVHTVTLEKALAQLEREGLIVRERRRGSFVAEPATAAPATRKTATGLIGLCGMGFNFKAYSAYWADLLCGIREGAAKAELQVLLLDMDSNRGWEQADGIVFCAWSAPDLIERAAPGQPGVSLLENTPGMTSVVADEFQGGRLATQHLIDLGHRRIAFLHGKLQPLLEQRFAGYRAALEGAGIAFDENLLRRIEGVYREDADSMQRGHDSMETWLKTDWDMLECTALVVHNDAIATGAIHAIHERGLRVPEDISVVGYDATEFARQAAPALTSVAVPLQRVGARGVELLAQQIKAGTAAPVSETLPVHLDVQGSTSQVKASQFTARRLLAAV